MPQHLFTGFFYSIMYAMFLLFVEVREFESLPDHNKVPDPPLSSHYKADNHPFDCTTFFWKS